MSVNSYISGLTLSDRNLSPRKPVLGVPRSIKAREVAPPPAAVDVGSVLSFVDGLTAQERDDVLFSVQLAQRGASGVYDRFAQVESWYNKYTEILQTIGWVVEELAFAKHDQSEGELRMDKAALAVISALATQNQLTILTEGLKALESLAENDEPIKLFDFHTSIESSGNFQLGSVEKAGNGAMGMVLGAFHFSADERRRRILFFSWGAKKVQFWTAAEKMVLNGTAYANHRNAVMKKLGNTQDYIDDLVLG
ncbi:MAG: hypothetical protein ABFD98_12280 [Syntrophobacteraceae bacterium]|nr:hypothetical protein [Desulfobacteraceae bacterium]